MTVQTLEGQTAFVTGAAQGNGAAIAKALARAGARVVISDITADRAKAQADLLLAEGYEALSVALDVRQRTDCIAVYKDVVKTCGDISILVNNAGICPRVPIDSDEFPRAWEDTVDINLGGIVNVTRAFLPSLRATRGTVVNIASIAAFVAVRSTLAYTASKAGVRGLTQAMAQEFAADGIRVNAIAPGQILTPMLAPSLADPIRKKEIEARILMGRIGESEELGGPVVFLCSAMSSFVNGITLPVDGGYLAV
ncbi:SDR family oxidoreductase [Rhizobium sp. Root1204]|uniref:SDR family NAD(P)-dependent oxidoreductase n=1 Tax=Rhizobium sp. Root1204 TaxID=1736428 RepID=UPI0007144CAA|nr:SDR family oxidoreductase [Rhizobium sp. Root1204]KQV41308.1 3-oxoacyl-ACP reductase [Rhizobium sp. Root1204]